MATVEIVEIAAGLQIGGGGFAGDAVAIMPEHAYAVESSQKSRCTRTVEIKDDCLWASDTERNANARTRIAFDLCNSCAPNSGYCQGQKSAGIVGFLAFDVGQNEVGGTKKFYPLLSLRLTAIESVEERDTMADVERRRVGLKSNRRFDGGTNMRARFWA
ncbi:GD20041 [Drosophila simulans]|uniref:GD20041 n=1 Tax=Drosophila simulans TaxID=7240 RepID=B4R1T6_DROSI|nr:GD20041 [Drosophila simulans]